MNSLWRGRIRSLKSGQISFLKEKNLRDTDLKLFSCDAIKPTDVKMVSSKPERHPILAILFFSAKIGSSEIPDEIPWLLALVFLELICSMKPVVFYDTTSTKD